METLPNELAQTASSSDTATTENEHGGYTVQSAVEKSQEQSQPREQPRSAVFVSHGMGQQIRFETLAQIAEGLRAEDDRAEGVRPGNESPDKRPEVIQIRAGEKELHGIRINLAGDHVVDIFEGYWAPLTEGQITLRNVISFLFNGGLNGCKNTVRTFTRFLFNNYCEFPSYIRTLIALILALMAVAALVSMNSAIALVAAGRPFFTQTKNIIDPFIIKLTTVFDLLLSVALIYLLVLVASYLLRHPDLTRGKRAFLGKITQVSFLYLTLPAIIAAGLIVAYLSYKYLGASAQDASWLAAMDRLLAPILSPGWHFNWWFGVILVSALAILVLPGIAYLAYRFSRKASGRRPKKKIGAGWVFVFMLLFAGALYLVSTHLMASILSQYQTESPNWVNLSPWALLLAASEMVRRLLVQYPGDVAIYVMPYSLDRFFTLREKIRETVTDDARVVFKATRTPLAKSAGTGTGDFKYDSIFFVGHSLGSVVVYDALNKLLSEDDDPDASLNVANRVKMMLTFGSPLDKIAFLFARPEKELCEARDALQSSAQPLIGDTKFRQFWWVNIFSPLDIISGELNFFDPPPQKTKRRGPSIPPYKQVANLTDPQATLYLAAHVEYWNNDLIFKILRSAITDDRPQLGNLIKENWVNKNIDLAEWLS